MVLKERVEVEKWAGLVLCSRRRVGVSTLSPKASFQGSGMARAWKHRSCRSGSTRSLVDDLLALRQQSDLV